MEWLKALCQVIIKITRNKGKGNKFYWIKKRINNYLKD